MSFICEYAMLPSSITFVKEMTVFQWTGKAKIEYSGSQYEDKNNMFVARSSGWW